MGKIFLYVCASFFLSYSSLMPIEQIASFSFSPQNDMIVHEREREREGKKICLLLLLLHAFLVIKEGRKKRFSCLETNSAIMKLAPALLLLLLFPLRFPASRQSCMKPPPPREKMRLCAIGHRMEVTNNKTQLIGKINKCFYFDKIFCTTFLSLLCGAKGGCFMYLLASTLSVLVLCWLPT